MIFVVFHGVMILLTVLLLRGHKADILAVWEKRWSGAEQNLQ